MRNLRFGLFVSLLLITQESSNFSRAWADTFYVTAYCSHEVVAISEAGNNLGTYADAVVTCGTTSLAFDSSGNLYVASNGDWKIRKYSPLGVSLGTYEDSSAGINAPWSLAFDSLGNLYVGNSGTHLVTRYSPTGANMGVFVSGPVSIVGLAFGHDGVLYVSDESAGTIRAFSSTGVDLGNFVTGLNHPEGLAVDKDGNVYVANQNNNTIEKYSPQGTQIGHFTSSRLNAPSGLVFDSNGNLYVVNSGNSTISRFTTTGTDLGLFATVTFPDNSAARASSIAVRKDIWIPSGVLNVRAAQREGTKLVDIFYDLANPQGNSLAVSVAVSTNNGTSFNLPATSFTPANGSLVTPGNSRQVTWNAGADYNNRSSSQVKFRVTAGGTLSADSAAVTVNTLDTGSYPIVQDVTSAYCSRMQHAYFLNGVSLSQNFTASVDWNGHPSGTIQFITPNGTQSGVQATQTSNVGTDFGVGGTLLVKAISADGTASLPYKANFDVINPPLGVPAALLLPSTDTLAGGSLVYLNANNEGTIPGSIWTFDQQLQEGVDQVPNDSNGDAIPGFTGKAFSFASALIPDVEIGGDGTGSALWTLDGADSGLNLGGFTFTPSVSGGPGWTYSQTSATWNWSGLLNVAIAGSGQTLPSYIWASPPIYVSGSVNLDVGANLQITGWNPNGYLNVAGTIPISAQADFIAGCGAADVMAIEGYIGGGPTMTLQFPAQPTLQTLGIQLEGGVRLVTWIHTWDLANLNYSWCLTGCSASASQAQVTRSLVQQMNAPIASQWKLLSRNYLKKSYAVFNNGAIAHRLALTQLSSQPATVSTMEANIFPYSDPAFAVNGTNQMLLWIWDNPVRSDENRTELVWSQWNGASWSNPTSVWDDATADFHPAVQVFTNGSALAVWENEQGALASGASLTDVAAGLEIAAAWFNPSNGVWTSANLTQNSYLDRTPQLAAAPNGQALLTWISNPSNSLLGATGTPNTVNSRLWDGGNWHDVGPITTNAGMLLWSSVAFDGSNGVFLAVIDGDDDQSTPTDEQLYGATFSNLAWSALTQLTSNGVQNAKPQAVYDSTGRLLVAWYQGSNIVMRVGDLNLSNATAVATLSGSSSQKDFKLVTGPAGQVSMVWEDLATDGSGPDPFLVNWDPTLGVWSQPLRLLNNTNELERSFSPAYDDTGALLMAYDRVAISYDTNNVPQFGQVDLMFMNYLIGGDLAVGSGDIKLDTPNPVPTQTVNISAVVHNMGELAVTNTQAVFFDGDPSSGGVMIGSTQTVAGVIAAGSNAVVQVQWVVPATTNSHAIYVTVDPAQVQEDRNRANNTASLTVMLPDLAINSMTVLTPSVTNRVISARVTNLGVIPSAVPVSVEFHQDATNGPLLATVPISALAPQAEYDASFSWDVSSVTFTSAAVNVYALVDPAGTVNEFSMANRIRFASVPTTVLPAPPAGTIASAISSYQISLSWFDSLQNATGFIIERSLNGGTFSLWTTVGAGTTNFIDGNVGCGSSYQYRITATNSFGVSDSSYVAVVSPSTFDSEGYGVPDCWRLQYFGHTDAESGDMSRAQDDADGDGMSNLQEYQAGTIPTDASSVFQITSVTPNPGGGFVIQWSSVAGKFYDVERDTDLSWSTVLTLTNGVAATPPTNTYTDTSATNSPAYFYRVRLKP